MFGVNDCSRSRIGCSMSHVKNKALNVFSKRSKATLKSCCSVNNLTADCKCCKHHHSTHGRHKMKRLRSRKERSQMSGGREASKTKSLHHHHQNMKNFAHFHSCCHTSRKVEPCPNRIAAAQEPSIITDNRLIGHHGLFNHEVKSVDIERLLSEQRKQEICEQQVPEKSCILSSTCHNPSPFYSKDLSGGHTNEAMLLAKVADPTANAQECRKKAEELCQGSDGTPGQSLQQELDPSSGSYKSSFSSKHSSLDVVAFKSKNYNSGMSEKFTESPRSPTGDKDNVKKFNKELKTHVISTPDQTPNQEKPPMLPAQVSALCPSPLQLSSSPIIHSRQDERCVSKSVNEIAARLCDSLHLPFLRRGSLVTKSREELVKALREKHGPQLKENLLKMKRSLSCGAGLTRPVVDEDVLFPADAPEYQTDDAAEFGFGTQRTHRKTPEWLTDPMDTSPSPLDGVLRPSCSPTVRLHWEPQKVSANDSLFSQSDTSCWAEKSPSSQHWGDDFSRSKSKESFLCDSFEDSYLNHSRAATENCRRQHSGNSIQTLTAQVTDRCSAEPGPFLPDRYSNYQSLSTQSHHLHQSNNFQTFSQFTQPSSCPPVSPHYMDMTHYPPSHMLDKETPLPFSSLPSPEPWSFPPMRLY